MKTEVIYTGYAIDLIFGEQGLWHIKATFEDEGIDTSIEKSNFFGSEEDAKNEAYKMGEDFRVIHAYLFKPQQKKRKRIRPSNHKNLEAGK